jgi:hypothetical protein
LIFLSPFIPPFNPMAKHLSFHALVLSLINLTISSSLEPVEKTPATP